MEKRFLVIDVGGTFTKYAVMNENCEFLKRGKIPTVQAGVSEFVESLAGIHEICGEVEGIAVSSAGVIDGEKGYMYNGGSLTFLQNLKLAEILEQRCAVKVTIENDARSAGLAEVWKGSLCGCKNAIAVIIGTAVGGAVIVDGHILKGTHCMAGEFSYMLTNAEDAENDRYALAYYGGVPALIHIASEKLGIPEKELSGEIIFSRAKEGDPEARECVRQFARRLAVAINNIHFMFDPEKIAIGGGVSAQPLLLDLIREELEKLNRIFPHAVPIPEVVNCQFFNDSNLIGALYAHLQRRRKQEIDMV